MNRLLVAGAAAVSLLLYPSLCLPQAAEDQVALMLVESRPLSITVAKTTNLIFPTTIISVDRGSSDILVRKAKGVENILQVKAARPSFEESNLSVITRDGRLYSFPVRYAKAPVQLNICLNNTAAAPLVPGSRPSKENAPVSGGQPSVHSWLPAILPPRGRPSAFRKKDRMTLLLSGIWVRGDVLLLRFGLANRSHIDYEPEELRFFVRDRRREKRTAFQQAELAPVETWKSAPVVRGRSAGTLVVALPKFTLPSRKYLSVHLREKAGSRNLSLKVSKRAILKAKKLYSSN
ncbi:conjugative transposon protein TraN [Paraflavisolibacter sp. H34]|uniref:conjugative transposon protein TraN n=1 Tax=Huijunlia imazamoxiresistens TaxID=3127457 RepID=UPI0030170813